MHDNQKTPSTLSFFWLTFANCASLPEPRPLGALPTSTASSSKSSYVSSCLQYLKFLISPHTQNNKQSIKRTIGANKYPFNGLNRFRALLVFVVLELYKPFCFNFSSSEALTFNISKLWMPMWSSWHVQVI